MPLEFLFEEDEDDVEDQKFGPDCDGCKNVHKKRVCKGCDAGELFDEKDPDGLDFHFNNLGT